MLTIRPQGGNDMTRVLAAAYQAQLTPGARITATAPEGLPEAAERVFAAIQTSRHPITGRQLQLATGYRGDQNTVQDKIRQWERMRADMHSTAPAAGQPPAWLEPPAWIHTPTRNRR